MNDEKMIMLGSYMLISAFFRERGEDPVDELEKLTAKDKIRDEMFNKLVSDYFDKKTASEADSESQPKLIEKITIGDDTLKIYQWDNKNDFTAEYLKNEWSVRGTYLEILEETCQALANLRNNEVNKYVKSEPYIRKYRTISCIRPYKSMEAEVIRPDGSKFYVNIDVNDKQQKIDNVPVDGFAAFSKPMDIADACDDIVTDDCSYILKKMKSFWNQRPIFVNDGVWKEFHEPLPYYD